MVTAKDLGQTATSPSQLGGWVLWEQGRGVTSQMEAINVPFGGKIFQTHPGGTARILVRFDNVFLVAINNIFSLQLLLDVADILSSLGVTHTDHYSTKSQR
jgi:hypothetical protein